MRLLADGNRLVSRLSKSPSVKPERPVSRAQKPAVKKGISGRVTGDFRPLPWLGDSVLIRDGMNDVSLRGQDEEDKGSDNARNIQQHLSQQRSANETLYCQMTSAHACA